MSHVGSGVLSLKTLPFSVALLPLALVGMWMGFQVQDRIDAVAFRKATLVVLLAILLIGGNSIRELLLVLAIGAVAGTYSSIFIASQYLVMWDRGEIGRFFRRSPSAAASSLMNLIGR